MRTGGVFLGRRDELAELRAGLDDVVSGPGRLFLLAGEAGVGKSRLLERVANEVEPTQVRAVIGRCWKPRAAPPLLPWIEVLRACTAGLPDETLLRLLGAGAPDIALLLPELTRLPGVVPPLPSRSPDARRRLFESVTDFLRNVAAEGGLVVGLDDLHAADQASLRLLQHVAENVGPAMILVLGTYRDADVRSVPHLHRLVAAIARHGRRLVLRGLDQRDAATLLEQAMAREVPPAVADEVHEATDGNPFFVQEVARLLRAEGDWKTPVPEDVREVVRRRLGAVPQAVRDALAVAAAVDRPFDLALLAAATGVASDAAAAAVDDAANRELVVEASAGRWQFVHELVQETIYHDIRISRRVALHRRVGEILEELGREQPDHHLAELGHHFYEAARGGDGSKAREYCARSGDAAMASLAFEEAAIRYGRALEAIAVTPPVDERERHPLLMHLARAHLRLGDPAAAQEFQRRALKSARAAGSPGLLAQAAVAFLDDEEPALEESQASVLVEVRTALGDTDDPLLAKALIAQARLARTREAAADLADRALAMARRLAHPETLRLVLDGWQDIHNDPDGIDARLEAADELLALARAADDVEAVQRARQRRVRQLLAAGDVAGVSAELEMAALEADNLRLPSLVAATTALAAGVALLQGRLDEAERLIGHAQQAARRSALRRLESDVYLQLYALRRQQGRPEEAAEVAERRIERLLDPAPVDLALRALALADLGKCHEARPAIGDVAGELLGSGTAGSASGAALVAEVSWILGGVEWAGAAYEFLLRWPDHHLVMAAGCSLGASSRYLGQLATLLGRPDDAEGHFQAAHQLHERLGAPAWLAHGRVDHARMLLARDCRGDGDRARQLLLAARRTYRALGMAAYDERAVAVLEGPSPMGTDATTETGELSLEGEYWAISYGGSEARLRDSKGLRYLARLLGAPGHEFHALDLVVGEGGGTRARRRAVRKSELDTLGSGDAGSVLDARAKAAYKRRLAELEAEIEEAAADNDLWRAERAQAEKDFLIRELAAAVGLGGRDRKAASDAERARQSVTRAIKGAIERISAAHPELGEHLRTTVRTGIYSSYAPDPRVPIRWDTP